MTESELLREVLRLAAQHNVMAFHSGDSRRDLGDNGFPDLVLCGPDGLRFAELKDATGSRSPGQTRWMYQLAAAGHRCDLWRPRDLDSGLVAKAIESLNNW